MSDQNNPDDHISLKELLTSRTFWTVYIPTIVLLFGGMWKLYDIGKDNGQTKFETEKNSLFDTNKILINDTIEKNNQILMLKRELRNCRTTVSYLKSDSSLNSNNNKKIKQNRPSTKPPHSSQSTNPEESFLHQRTDEIKKLKRENLELRKNLELISEEKNALRLKIQKYINEQELLIIKLENLKDKISIAQGAARKEAEEDFSTLLEQAKSERQVFDETEEGKELQRKAEEYQKELAKMKRQQLEQQKQNEDLSKGLSSLKSDNAAGYFRNAKSTIAAAEGITNWFGFNSKEKCKLILEAAKSYEKATELGKDCSEEIEALKKDYSKCF